MLLDSRGYRTLWTHFLKCRTSATSTPMPPTVSWPRVSPPYFIIVSSIIRLHKTYFLIATSLAIASDTFMAVTIVYHLWFKSKPTTQRWVETLGRYPYCLNVSRTRGVISWLILYYVNSGVILMWVDININLAQKWIRLVWCCAVLSQPQSWSL